MNNYFLSIFLACTELVDQVTKASGKQRNDCFHTYIVGTAKTVWAIQTGQDSEKKLVEQYVFLLKHHCIKFLNKEKGSDNYGIATR